MTTKPVIVGEANPFGGDAYYAMYPEPSGCAGDRLCRIVMGLRQETYLASFERVNLLRGSRWSAPRAREAAGALVESRPTNLWILLGRKVTAAFGLYAPDAWPPPRVFRKRNNPGVETPESVVLVLPHPSGLNRMWGDPALVGRCRALLAGALPDVPFGELDRAVAS